MTASAASGSRAEWVAEADRLALVAAQAPSASAGTVYARAAELRELSWRLERRPADALEAGDLRASATRVGGVDGCRAALAAALLLGEERGDPSAAVRAIEEAELTPGDCAERARRTRAVLAAYRPLSSLISGLGRSATAAASADANAIVEADEGGVVMQPAHELPSSAGPLRLVSVERYSSPESARVVVTLNRATRFRTGFLPGEGKRGPRLFVDLRGASFKGPREYAAGGLLERVRLGEQQDATRVVLDLAETAFRRIFYLPEPFRLVIDVSKRPVGNSEAEPTAPVASGATSPSRTRRVRRVVLDPGHGGSDPGATGPGGLREKDVTLDVAHRAAPLLARELGVSTLLTRDTDDYVALPERTARANAFGADLFISIHCNASPDAASRGVMTFVLADSRDPEAARLAAVENAASSAAGSELASAMGEFIDAGSLARALHFAELLQRAARASLAAGYPDVPIQGVRRAGFYVLAGAHMPAVLFETTFISSPVDEARLDTGAYRQKLADAIVNAVRAYRDGL